MPVDKNLKRLLGQRIAKLRKARGLSQEKFAEKVNILPRAMSCIENGVNYPMADTLERITNALGLKPKDLFDFEYDYSNKELYSLIIGRSKLIKEDIDKLKLVSEILEKIL